MNTMDYILGKTQEGWGFSIECKSKGREYEISYEALCSRKSDKREDLFGWRTAKHAVGDDFMECISNLFGDTLTSDHVDSLLKAKMLECWNMDIGFSTKDGAFTVDGHAKQLNDDDGEEDSWRYADGSNLEEMLSNLFDHYNPNNRYAVAFLAKIEEMKRRSR